MAYQDQGRHDITHQQGSDLSAARFQVMNLATDGYVDVCGAGALCLGILQDDALNATVGTSVTVRVAGISKAIADAAIEEGALVAAGTSGKVVTAVTGDYVLGMAQDAAADDGDFISVLVNPTFVVIA